MTKEERIEQIRAEMAQDPDYYERVRQEIRREGHARLDEIQASLRRDPAYYESLTDADLEKLAAVQAALDKFLKSDPGRQLLESVRKYNLLTAEVMEKYGLTSEQLNEILGANVEQLHAIEFSDFIEESITEDDHLAVNGLLDAIVKRAREEGRPVSEIIKETAEAVQTAPAVTYKHGGTVETNIDKLSNIFTGISAPQPEEIDGQLSFAAPIPVKYEKTGAPEVTLTYYYAQDTDALKRLGIDGKFTAYDYFVQTALDNLLTRGNELVSMTQIYKEMHGNKRPAKKNLKKLLDSLYRNVSTTITIDDYEVMKAWNKLDPGKGKKYHKITGQLAPIVIGEERYTANGQLVDNAVRILGHPTALQPGKKIGQVAQIPRVLLENDIPKTDRYYRAAHYLLTNISMMRHGTRKHKILYSTYYRETGETTARQKDLAKEMLYNLLEHYKKCKWIKNYNEDVTKTTGEVGVKILFDKEVYAQIKSNQKALEEKKKR